MYSKIVDAEKNIGIWRKIAFPWGGVEVGPWYRGLLFDKNDGNCEVRRPVESARGAMGRDGAGWQPVRSLLTRSSGLMLLTLPS